MKPDERDENLQQVRAWANFYKTVVRDIEKMNMTPEDAIGIWNQGLKGFVRGR